MTEPIYRVVLDTNEIIGAGSRWLERRAPAPDGNVHRRVLIRVAEAHAGLYCAEIVDEYLEKLLERGHPPSRAEKLMIYITGAFTQISITSARAPFPPTDLDDEVFLLCAIDGKADYLISEDSSLVNLSAMYTRPRIGKCAVLAGELGV